jgi:hypothetical protein
MPAADPRLRAASSRLAALTRHRSPVDPDVAAARREVREAQLAADVRRLVTKLVSATERDAVLASGRDGAS